MLKFAYQDFLDDRRFKKTTEKNIRNYQTMRGKLIAYCSKHEVVSMKDITYNHVRQQLMECQERGNKAGPMRATNGDISTTGFISAFVGETFA
ncbi:site-specific recombinase XerC [Paenibacillus castaneae]|nr:site-specific recombinase XerC [Paenibacillus castaneae]